MRHAIAVILVLAGPARADDSEDLRPEDYEIRTQVWPDRKFDAIATIAVDANNRTGAGLTAGVELRMRESGCGGMSTSGEVSARTGATTLSATHRAHLCLGLRLIDRPKRFEVSVFPIGIDHALGWNVTPTLSSPRFVLDRAFTSERVDATVALAEIPIEEFHDWGIVAMPFTSRVEWLGQTLADGESVSTIRYEIRPGLVGLAEPDGDGRFVLFAGRMSEEIFGVDLIRLDRFPTGSPLRIDLAVGSAETLRYVDGELVEEGGFTGGAGLWLDHGPISVGARAFRDYFETIDDALVQDDRATLTARYADARRRVITATGFASRQSLIWIDGSGQIPYRPTYGVELAGSWPIAEGLDATVTAGWARSFYARVDDMAATAPSPTVGLQLGAGITGRIQR
jgi:hypothetical protein